MPPAVLGGQRFARRLTSFTLKPSNRAVSSAERCSPLGHHPLNGLLGGGDLTVSLGDYLGAAG